MLPAFLIASAGLQTAWSRRAGSGQGAVVKLRGRVAVVTGARSGIGLATAQMFASSGSAVVLADVRDASAEAAAIGPGCQAVRVDVAEARGVQRLIDGTFAQFGRLDILVNNAGVVLAKRVTETDEAEWDRLMSVNLKGVFLCSRAAALAMRRCGGGTIVNVASELGVVGSSDIAAYCASKGGVVQLTKAMAIDHAMENIRVNCVCPGPVATPLLEAIIAAAPDPGLEEKDIVNDRIHRHRRRRLDRAVSFTPTGPRSPVRAAVFG